MVMLSSTFPAGGFPPLMAILQKELKTPEGWMHQLAKEIWGDSNRIYYPW